MKRLKVLSLVLALGAVFCLPGMAGAAQTVLGFDGVSTPDPWYGYGSLWDGTAALPTNYGGFTWSASDEDGAQWGVFGNQYYRNRLSNSFNFPSNPNAVFNRSPQDFGFTGAEFVTISSATPFNFVGADFSTLTETGYGTQHYWGAFTLSIIGKLDGEEKYNQRIDLNLGALAWTSLDMNNIDTLIFTPMGKGGWNVFLMDEFTTTTAPVPEPSTMILLGSGLVGLVGYGRRRFKK